MTFHIYRWGTVATLKQKLSYLMLGQQGGENRIKILELLKDRSYNLNQLATTLDLNYRTVKHHINILSEHELIESSGEGYGDVYFLSPKLEKNFELLEEMKNKLETVSESPKLYQKVIEQSHEGIILIDENRDIIFLNNSAKEITGYEDEDLLGKNIETLFKSNIERSLDQVINEDDFMEEIVKIEPKDGEKKTVLTTIDYFLLDKEKHNGFSLLMRDVTEEEKRKDILDALMENSRVIIAYLDANFDLLYVNSAYAEKADSSPEELTGKNHFDLFPDEKNRKIFQEALELRESRYIEERPLLQNDDSDKEQIFWSVQPVEREDEEIKGLILSLCEHP